ncbi:hypothetical protein Tco_0686246 [Tanacetum coccineum]
MKELRDTPFVRTDEEDANENVEKVLEIFEMIKLPSVSKDEIMLTIFPKTLIGATRRWIKSEPSDSQGPIPKMTPVNAKKAILNMADHSQMWHDGADGRNRVMNNSAR